MGTSKVYLAREIPSGREDCTISIWAEVGKKPPATVALLETHHGVLCSDKDLILFQRTLKILVPSFDNLKVLFGLFQAAAPGILSIVESKKSYGWLAKYEELWHEPRIVEGHLEFFCCDYASGRFIKVLLTAAYDLEIEDMGPGKKLPRR